MFLGIILIVVGVAALLGVDLGDFWPIILIVVGAVLLLRALQRRRRFW